MFAYHDLRQDKGEDSQSTASGLVKRRTGVERRLPSYSRTLFTPATSMPCLDAEASVDFGPLVQEQQGHAAGMHSSDAVRPLAVGGTTPVVSGLSAQNLPGLLDALSFSHSLKRLAGFRLPVTLAYLTLPGYGPEACLHPLKQQLEEQGQQVDLLTDQALLVLYLGPRLPEQGCQAVEQLLVNQITKALVDLSEQGEKPGMATGRNLEIGWLHGETDLFADWQSLALRLAELSLSSLSLQPKAS